MKPKSTIIDPFGLNPKDIEYFCNTRVIDEIVTKRKKLEFDSDLADFMDKKSRMYFVVLKSGGYDVVSGETLEPFLRGWKLDETPVTPEALICIDHFIKTTHKIA